MIHFDCPTPPCKRWAFEGRNPPFAALEAFHGAGRALNSVAISDSPDAQQVHESTLYFLPLSLSRVCSRLAHGRLLPPDQIVTRFGHHLGVCLASVCQQILRDWLNGRSSALFDTMPLPVVNLSCPEFPHSSYPSIQPCRWSGHRRQCAREHEGRTTLGGFQSRSDNVKCNLLVGALDKGCAINSCSMPYSRFRGKKKQFTPAACNSITYLQSNKGSPQKRK